MLGQLLIGEVIMSNKEKTIESLQFFVTELSSQALSHEIHGRIFNSQGFTKLGKKYLTRCEFWRV